MQHRLEHLAATIKSTQSELDSARSDSYFGSHALALYRPLLPILGPILAHALTDSLTVALSCSGAHLPRSLRCATLAHLSTTNQQLYLNDIKIVV